MAEFQVVTTWTMEGRVTIEADSIEEAQQIAEDLCSWEMDETEELSDSFEVLEVEEGCQPAW
jgi:hypothetical protein